MHRLYANKSDKSVILLQNNSGSFGNLTNYLENFANLLQGLASLLREVCPNQCVFTSNPARIWEFRPDFSDSDIRPITTHHYAVVPKELSCI